LLNIKLMDELLAANIHFSFEEALNEIKKKRLESDFLSRVENDLQLFPNMSPLIERINIVMFRQVATPLHEVIRVINFANKHDIPVIIVEYLNDKFTPSVNSYKYNLVNLPIYNKNRLVNGEPIIDHIKISDISKMEGKMLKEVVTINGESMATVHHDLLYSVLDPNKYNYSIIDISEWFKFFGKPDVYYYEFFKFFLAHNIQAEVYFDDGTEEYFTNNIIKPNHEKIFKEYSSRPVIWNFLDGTSVKDRYFWDCYPTSIAELLNKKGYH